MIKLSFQSEITNSLYNLLSSIKYLRATSYDKQSNQWALFSYRSNYSIKLDYKLLNSLIAIEEQIGIQDLVLSRFICNMLPGDYIDWSSKSSTSIAKMMLFSVTDGIIEFEDQKVFLKQGDCIVFPMDKKYRVPPVSSQQIGMVWLIRRSFNAYQELNGVSSSEML